MGSNGRSKIFVSYSRVDLAFTNELVAGLEQSADFEILIDRAGIGHGEAWRERLGRLIVECDTMVFVLSPDSVSSEVCAWEIGEARRLAKRIIPVLWRAVDFAKVPKHLSAINAVPFDGEHAVSGLPKLVAALNSDLTWLREHTRFGERALEWEQSRRTPAYLLRGAALVAAREWLAAKPSNAPAPTALQREFLQASEEDESRLLSDERARAEALEKAMTIAEAERDAAQQARASEARAARRVVRATTAGLLVAVVLFIAASAAGWLAWQKARDEQQAATRADAAATRAALVADRAAKQRDAALLAQSRFVARAAQGYLTRDDAANAVGLARAALPTDPADPDRPFAIEAAQVIFDAYGSLRELATLRGHTRALKGALALPDDRLVTWGRDGTLRWWRDDGALLKTVSAHRHPTKPDTPEDTGVHGVLRLRDGRLLSWGVDKTAKLWNDDGTFDAEFLNEASWIRIQRLHDGRIGALIGNEFRVFSAMLEPLFVLRSPLTWMRGARLLADGRFLTWQSESGKGLHTAMLWGPDGAPGAVLDGHERMLRGGFELTDGRLVTFENGPSLRIWTADGQLETVIDKAHDHVPFGEFAFPLNDGRFFTWGQEAYHDNVWWGRLWTAQGESTPLIEASDPPLQGFALDDGRLLLGTNAVTPTIWNTDGSRGPMLRGHEEGADGAAQWTDGRIATRGADGTARIWSRDGVPLLMLRGHEGGVSGIEPLVGQRYLTWSFSDRTARIWGHDPQPRSLLRLTGGDAERVQQLSTGSIAVHTNADSIALYGPDLRPAQTLHNDAREIDDLIEIADGRLLTRGANHSNRASGPALRMWSASGEFIADLAGPDVEFVQIAQTPSGRVLGFDQSGQVWIWRPDGQPEGKRKTRDGSPIFRVDALSDGRFVTHGEDRRLQLWGAEGQPGDVIRIADDVAPKHVTAFGDGGLLVTDWKGPPRIWSSDGDRWSTLDLGELWRTDSATPLPDGTMLLNQFGGRLVIVSPDGGLREVPVPAGSGTAITLRKVFRLSDGRLIVSTPNQETRLLGTDGESGQQLLDRSVAGARLLSDGSLLIWPATSDNDLQIIDPAGRPGPVLRGHESAVKQAIQLADGRILSWAKDATVRIWPGSTEQAIAWADEVIARLRPLTPAERCEHYLEAPHRCTEDGRR